MQKTILIHIACICSESFLIKKNLRFWFSQRHSSRNNFFCLLHRQIHQSRIIRYSGSSLILSCRWKQLSLTNGIFVSTITPISFGSNAIQEAENFSSPKIYLERHDKAIRRYCLARLEPIEECRWRGTERNTFVVAASILSVAKNSMWKRLLIIFLN